MKSHLFILLFLFISMFMTVSCSSDNDDNIPNDEEIEVVIEGEVLGYDEFGSLMADFTKEQMDKAGFTLGDAVTVIVGGETISMPYYDGFYNHSGEYLVVAYPTYKTICIKRNNQGVPDNLKNRVGEPLTIKLERKGGYLSVQEALGMKYTNNRDDYASDVIFANQRAVNIANLAPNRLYRSASPFDNQTNRAQYSSELMHQSGINTVLNLSDTEEKIISYSLPQHSQTMWDNGNVILCPLKSDPTATDYNERLIAALKEMSVRKGPFLVHCVEGKDRTGYVCALLEGLCGATYEDIVTDYLITYDNYYGVNRDNKPDVCNTLVSLRLNECLMYYADVQDESQLSSVDYQKAFSDYLLSHGMTDDELAKLVRALTLQ